MSLVYGLYLIYGLGAVANIGVAPSAAYYLLLLSNGTLQLFAPEMLDRDFDNMLLHLLHGEFTIDRKAIDFEAVTRDGKTYAYFGVFPALLRLIAMPFTDIAQAELARLSCLTAVVIFVALQLGMLLIVQHQFACRKPETRTPWRHVGSDAAQRAAAYIFGSSWIYHEPILWSAAMAGAFNLVIVRAAFSAGRLPGRDLVFLATLGGLTINTRPSVGVALCLGTILLVAWTMWCRLYVPHRRARVFSSKEARLITTVLPPIAVLGLTAVAVGVINFERWGNPLTFADFRLYDWLYRHAGFADALRNYGEFDVGRMWIGVLYYATGIPFMLKAAPPFAEFLRARYQGIEAPPVIPLLTNPISVLLAGVGRYCLWWRPELPARSLAMLRFALVGHASTVLLILSAMYLALRYRFDFAPFVTLAASIGYRSISITAAGAQRLGESSCVSPLSACASLAFSPATCGASQCRWRSASLCFLSHRSPTPRSSRDW